MGRAAPEDWPKGFIVVVPRAWRGDGLWTDMQTEVQERIGTTLREMYADLLRQPLSPQLAALVRDIKAGWKASSHDG
jgi:hypothetical protein